MSFRPRVALFVETLRAYGRGVLKGIWQHVQENDRWSLLFRPRGLEEPTTSWRAVRRGDGIIAHVTTPDMAAILTEISHMDQPETTRSMDCL